MLSIKAIGSSEDALSYYANLGQEDYYVGGGEPPGNWWGEGAKALGLSGQVDGQVFRNLLEGTSPDGTHDLVMKSKKKRRAGFDLTFSVPKSVSAAWSAGNLEQRKEIEAANHRALMRVLTELQEHCGFTRLGYNGTESERGKLMAAIFRHDTSRGIPGELPDPNLHHHVVLCNVVAREDGGTNALDARHLFRRNMKMALGALYRAELSRELEQIGLRSHRPEKEGKPNERVSWFELDCVSPELISEFSKRRREIEKWLIKHKLSGTRAAEKAALATRTEKEQILRETLIEHWQEVAREFGLSHEILEAEKEKRYKPRNIAIEAYEAIRRAVKRITDSNAHFSELELVRYAAEEAQGKGVGISAIKERVAHALTQDGTIVKLDYQVRGETHYTTQEMLFLERRVLKIARDSRGNDLHSLARSDVAKAISGYEERKTASLRKSLLGSEEEFKLFDEQVEAVYHVTAGNDSVTCVNGLAGTGKSTLLEAAREAWEAAGYRVLGTALAGKAACELQKGSGIESQHIQSLLRELRQERIRLGNDTIVVLDEAGMVGTRDLCRLAGTVERAGAKLVMVGDTRQLQAISAGAIFQGVINEVGAAELTHITRQRDEVDVEAVKELAVGEAESALAKFASRGLLQVQDDRDEAIEALVNDWEAAAEKDLEETLIFVGTNFEGREVNQLCQQRRLEAGHLSDEVLEVEDSEFRVGDRVLFTKGEKLLGLENGMVGTVVGLNKKQQSLMIRLDDGKTLRIHTDAYAHLKLGYAVTTHKGQGATVNNAFVLSGGGMTDREISYVQASRARDETRIYTDRLSLDEDGDAEVLEVLAKQMSRSRAKDLAVDYERERIPA